MLNWIIRANIVREKKSRCSLKTKYLCGLLSRVGLFAAPWTIAHQAPLSMEFSREEYWSGQPCLLPWDCPDPGIQPGSPAFQVDPLPSEPAGKPKTK